MKSIAYEPIAGMSINHACSVAIQMSREQDAEVKFRFNTVDLVARQGKGVMSLVKEWSDEITSRSIAYANSDEGKAAKETRNREVERKQSKVDALLRLLDHILAAKSQNDLMVWLRWFVEVSDDIDVKFDKNSLASKLESAGFIHDYGVGNPPEWFDSRPKTCAYIVGQVIDCLRRGMPPHPVTISFIEKWEAIEERDGTPSTS